MLDGFSVRRAVGYNNTNLAAIVAGLENSPSVSGRTQDERKAFLATVRVAFTNGPGFMHVDTDGTLHISAKYWQTGKLATLYLDLVHELVHVKQQRDGRDLYDERYAYVDRPTEIEAYKTAAKESRRLKLPKSVILNHMDVPWVTAEEKKRLHRAVFGDLSGNTTAVVE